jgi:acetyl-CoA synthetase
MLEKFLTKTEFDSYEDFMQNFHIKIPKNFNFAYDVVDEWARIEPNKKALLWTNETGEVRQYTFADIKRESDKTASFFLQLGIKRGDMVMLILKRRYQFWYAITALHKIGAVVIPRYSPADRRRYNIPLQRRRHSRDSCRGR